MEFSNKKFAVCEAKPGRFYTLVIPSGLEHYLGKCLNLNLSFSTYGGEPNIVATATFENQSSFDVNDLIFKKKCLIECNEKTSVYHASIGKYYRSAVNGKYLGKYLGVGSIYLENFLGKTKPLVAFDRCSIVDNFHEVDYLIECSEEK